MTLFMDLEWTPALLGFFEDLHHSPIGQRGRTYVNEGRVNHLTIAPDGLTISAAIQGSGARPYLTTIRLMENDYLRAECSCPVGEDCKHGYALALTVAGAGFNHGSKFQGSLKLYLTPAMRHYGWHAPAGLEPALAPLFVKVDTSASAAHPNHNPAHPTPKMVNGEIVQVKPGAAEPGCPWWERLWEARTDAERQRCLVEALESRFGANRYYDYSYAFELVIGLKRLGNNAAILTRLEAALEQQARADQRQLRKPDPKFLEFIASDAVRQANEEFTRKNCEAQLREWIERAAPKAAPLDARDCTLELFWRLTPTPWGIPMATFELLITTAKMIRRRRKPMTIRQLSTDIARGVRTTTPLMREVVDWLTASFNALSRYEHYKSPWGDDGLIPIHSVAAWIAAWGARDVLLWDDGTPVSYDPRPARLVIERTAEGKDLWALEYPERSLEMQTLVDAQVFCEEDRGESSQTSHFYSSSGGSPVKGFFVRHGGLIHPLDTCGMGLNALLAARTLGEAPVEMFLKKPAGVRLMRRLIPARAIEGAEGGLGDLVRVVPVRPVVEIKMAQGAMTLAAYGRSGCGRVFLRDAAGDWTALPDTEKSRRWLTQSPFERATEEPASEQLSMFEEQAPVSAVNPEDPATILLGGEALPNNPQSAIQNPQSPQIVLPRAEDVEPLEHWLKTIMPPGSERIDLGQERTRFRWSPNQEGLAQVVRGFYQRPQGPLYLGNAEFLKLVTPAARPKFKIQAKSAGVDWLAVSVEMESELAHLGSRELEELLSSTQDALIRLPDGRLYQREGLEDYQRELAAIEEAGLTPGAKNQRLHAFHLAGEAGKKLIELGGGDENLAQLSRAAAEVLNNFKGIPRAAIAKTTADSLRPYQRAGADFLAWACRTFGGALLADDMGLGKTLMVLATLTALRKDEKERRPTLVICPASVAHNWQREARRFAPQLKTLVIERGEGRKVHWERFHEYDLVIKNYSLTRRDADVIRKYEWLMICVDEAQAIKNPNSDIAAVVKSIPARYRVALTGTPIENRLSDMISIMEFATPGFLPELEGRDPAAQARRLRAWLRPVLLRRMKGEVAPELPERIEERIDCTMTANQRLAYLAEVKRTRELLHGLPGQKVAGAGRIQMLAALTRLRQLCCDPGLVALPNLGAGKVDELMNLLPPILESGNKVLLFSQFVRMLKRLEERLKKDGVPTFMLTGQTPAADRQDLVDRFEQDKTPSVFLISLKAGGTGLNLVSASHVVLFDPWWNPAVEAQAIDRTHRIGQDKTVLAFRLVAEGTIEERILELQEQKRGLVRNVLEEDAFNRTLSREDFEFLLG